MAKKVLSIGFTVLTLAILVGCSSEPSAGEQKAASDKFEQMNSKAPEGKIMR